MGIPNNSEDIAVKCREGAKAALELVKQGKLARQCNEEFERHTGCKLRYHNRADFIRLLKFYASV